MSLGLIALCLFVAGLYQLAAEAGWWEGIWEGAHPAWRAIMGTLFAILVVLSVTVAVGFLYMLLAG